MHLGKVLEEASNEVKRRGGSGVESGDVYKGTHPISGVNLRSAVLGL